MDRYSILTRDRIFMKGYGFFFFVKNMGKKLGKNIMKKLSGKCSQRLLDHAKQSATDALKSVSKKKTIQKSAEATVDLIDNKIADKTTKISKIPSQINLEIIESETEHKERYISPEKKQHIIDD